MCMVAAKAYIAAESVCTAFPTLILMRTELMDGSINTLSVSFREMTTGFSSTSFVLPISTCRHSSQRLNGRPSNGSDHAPLWWLGKSMTLTSGLLCLSTSWQAKLCKHIAAVSVLLTHARYGCWDVAMVTGQTTMMSVRRPLFGLTRFLL